MNLPDSRELVAELIRQALFSLTTEELHRLESTALQRIEELCRGCALPGVIPPNGVPPASLFVEILAKVTTVDFLSCRLNELDDAALVVAVQKGFLRKWAEGLESPEYRPGRKRQTVQSVHKPAPHGTSADTFTRTGTTSP